MALRFTVGNQEQHLVVFTFDKFWGNLTISVDGEVVTSGVEMYSLKLTKSYRFRVGEHEQHDVQIDKTRALVLAGFRPQTLHAWVDGTLVAQGLV